jgi:hypothetical protein
VGAVSEQGLSGDFDVACNRSKEDGIVAEFAVASLPPPARIDSTGPTRRGAVI